MYQPFSVERSLDAVCLFPSTWGASSAGWEVVPDCLSWPVLCVVQPAESQVTICMWKRLLFHSKVEYLLFSKRHLLFVEEQDKNLKIRKILKAALWAMHRWKINMHKNTVGLASSCLVPGCILWQRNTKHSWLIPGNPKIQLSSGGIQIKKWNNCHSVSIFYFLNYHCLFEITAFCFIKSFITLVVMTVAANIFITRASFKMSEFTVPFLLRNPNK